MTQHLVLDDKKPARPTSGGDPVGPKSEPLSELECLLRIVHLTEDPRADLDEVAHQVVDTLADAWSDQVAGVAKITLGDKVFSTGDREDCPVVLSSPVQVHGGVVGAVEVHLQSALAAGPRGIVAAVASHLGHVIARVRSSLIEAHAEERFRVFVENANDIVYSVTPDGTFNYVSPNWSDWLGEPAETAVGKPLERFVHPPDLERCRAYLHQVLTTGQKQGPIEYRVRHPDGTLRWHESKGAPLRDGLGRVTEYLGIARDVTEAKRAKLLAEDAFRRIDLLARHVPGVLYQFCRRPDGTSYFPYASEGIRQIYGVTPEQVRHDAKLVFEALHPDDLERIEASINRSARTLQEWRDEYRVRFRDGRVIWVEGEASPQPLTDGSILWHGFIRDISYCKRAELRAEEHWRSMMELLERMPVGVFVVDGESRRIESANATSVRLAGASGSLELVDHLVDETLLERRHEDLSPMARPLPEQTECCLRRADGSQLTVLVSSIHVRLDDRDKVIECFLDLTSQKRAERLLQDSEDLLRSTLDALTASITVVDHDGQIILTNKAYRNFALENGAEVPDVDAGANYLRACDDAEGPDSEQAHAFAQGLRDVLSGAVGSFEQEYPCHSPHEERWFVARVSPVMGGTHRRVVVAHEDISDRKRGQVDLVERLRVESLIAEIAGRFVGTRTEDTQAEIVRALHRIIEVLDMDAGVHCGLTEATPDAFVLLSVAHHAAGSSMPEGVDIRDALPWVFNRLRGATEPLWILDVRSLPPEAAKDRATYDRLGALTVIYLRLTDAEGALTGFLAFALHEDRPLPHGVISRLQIFAPIFDSLLRRARTERALLASIAERERLQAQLTQAQKLESVGRLAGGVAHDFNNLMMGIMGYTEACREELPPGHPAIQWLDDILTESERSVRLVRQLLTFARKQGHNPVSLDLNEQIESMMKMLRRLIGERIDVDWSPTPNLPAIYADPTHIDQVMANLCVNAADAIDGVGKIVISLSNVVMDAHACAAHPEMAPGEYVLLTVQDTGCGMDDETKAKAFEPFFTTKEPGRGTGLGLSTVYGIVRQSNGFIDIVSALGRGTTFRIFFPVRWGKGPHPVPAPSEETLPGGTETILLVEDEHSIRITLAKSLKHLGYRVLVAEHPEAALSLVREHRDPIQLLLSDVVMPGMSGVTLAARLSGIYPLMETILMSGYADELGRDHGYLAGRATRLAKPISLAVLAKAIRSALARAQQPL